MNYKRLSLPALTAVATLAVALASATAQIEIPRKSPEAEVSTTVGLTDVEVSYFRPGVRGRKIFGAGDEFLVPYGKLWRTGANSGTVVEFSDDVKVNGNLTPKGKYLLFTWPGASEWTVSLYKDLSIGGDAQKYDKAQEAVRFTVSPEKTAEFVETFTVDIADLSATSESANIQLRWEYTSVKIPVQVDYDARVMRSIESVKMDENPRSYLVAAQYYLDRGRSLDKALAWVNKYFEKGNKDGEFYNLLLKAEIQKAMGDKASAGATAKKALEAAKSAKNDFGYAQRITDFLSALK